MCRKHANPEISYIFSAQQVLSIVRNNNARHKNNISQFESIAFRSKLRCLLGSTHLIHCTAVVVAAAHGVEALCIEKNKTAASEQAFSPNRIIL